MGEEDAVSIGSLRQKMLTIGGFQPVALDLLGTGLCTQFFGVRNASGQGFAFEDVDFNLGVEPVLACFAVRTPFRRHILR